MSSTKLPDDDKNGVTGTKSGSGGGGSGQSIMTSGVQDPMFDVDESAILNWTVYDTDADLSLADVAATASTVAKKPDADRSSAIASTNVSSTVPHDMFSDTQFESIIDEFSKREQIVPDIDFDFDLMSPHASSVSGSGRGTGVGVPYIETDADKSLKLVFHSPACLDDTNAVDVLGKKLQSLEIKDFGEILTGARPMVFHPKFLGDVMKTSSSTPAKASTTTQTTPLFDTLILHSPMPETWTCLQQFYEAVGLRPRVLTFESPLPDTFLRNIEPLPASSALQNHALRDVSCLQIVDSSRPSSASASSTSDNYLHQTFVGVQKTMPSVQHLSLLVTDPENQLDPLRRYRAFLSIYGLSSLKSLCIGPYGLSAISQFLRCQVLPHWVHIAVSRDVGTGPTSHATIRGLLRSIAACQCTTMRAVSVTNLTASVICDAIQSDVSFASSEKLPEFPSIEKTTPHKGSSATTSPSSIRLLLHSESTNQQETLQRLQLVNAYLSRLYEMHAATTASLRRVVVEATTAEPRTVETAEQTAAFREQTLRASTRNMLIKSKAGSFAAPKHKADSDLVPERSPKRMNSPKTTVQAKAKVAASIQHGPEKVVPLLTSTVQITKPLRWAVIEATNGFPKNWAAEIKADTKPGSVYPYANLFHKYSPKDTPLEALAVNCAVTPRSWTPSRFVEIRQVSEPISCLIYNAGKTIRYESSNGNALESTYGHVIFKSVAPRSIQLVSSKGTSLTFEMAVASTIYTLKLPPTGLFEPVDFQIASSLGASDVPLVVLHQRNARLFSYDRHAGGHVVPFALVQQLMPPRQELVSPVRYHVADVLAMQAWMQRQPDAVLRQTFPTVDLVTLRSRYQFVCRPILKVVSDAESVCLCNDQSAVLRSVESKTVLSKLSRDVRPTAGESVRWAVLRRLTFDRFDVDGHIDALLEKQARSAASGALSNTPLPLDTPSKVVALQSLTREQCMEFRARIAAWQLLLLSTGTSMLMAVSSEDIDLGGNSPCQAIVDGTEVHFHPQTARNQYGYMLMMARERLKASRGSSKDALSQLRAVGRQERDSKQKSDANRASANNNHSNISASGSGTTQTP